MSRLEVRVTGPLTVVQDLGRPGLAGLGVPESGALDPGALRLANRLVGNPEGAAGLETVCLGSSGLVLRARGAVVVAAAGAPVTLAVSDGSRRRTHGGGSAVRVEDGAELAVGAPSAGLRCWLAVRGGVRRERLLGSASTDVLSGLGEPLTEGEELEVGPAPATPVPALDHAPQRTPATGTVVLRAVRGPRDDWFTEAAVASLTRPWTVDQRSNRVGVRLDGDPLERRSGGELPSEGTVAGSVQVASNGLPVLFLADHPVTGGYPVVATVVSADLPLAAQLVPGQRLRLRWVAGPRLPHTRLP